MATAKILRSYGGRCDIELVREKGKGEKAKIDTTCKITGVPETWEKLAEDLGGSCSIPDTVESRRAFYEFIEGWKVATRRLPELEKLHEMAFADTLKNVRPASKAQLVKAYQDELVSISLALAGAGDFPANVTAENATERIFELKALIAENQK